MSEVSLFQPLSYPKRATLTKQHGTKQTWRAKEWNRRHRSTPTASDVRLKVQNIYCRKDSLFNSGGTNTGEHRKLKI